MFAARSLDFGPSGKPRGPVTWYAMSYACGPSDGRLPAFRFRGARYKPPSITSVAIDLVASGAVLEPFPECILNADARFASGDQDGAFDDKRFPTFRHGERPGCLVSAPAPRSALCGPRGASNHRATTREAKPRLEGAGLCLHWFAGYTSDGDVTSTMLDGNDVTECRFASSIHGSRWISCTVDV
jgi:hypothetical protein